MSPHLPNSLAIITGSSQGLGKLFASRLLAEGAKVCISDVKVDQGRKVLEEFREKFGKENVCFIACDVTKEEQIVSLYEGWENHFNQKVNIFCNNAGINHSNGWRQCMEVDIMSVICGTEVALNRMGQQAGGEGGMIVNTASLAGILKGFNRDSVSYYVAKHGVVSLTRSLGQKHLTRRTGVQHMAICPAFANTDILDGLGVKRDVLEEKEGIMDPGFVADCFLELVKTGQNGDVMIVRKNTPPFIYPDFSLPLAGLLSIGARVFRRGKSTKIVRGKHQVTLVTMISVLCIITLSQIAKLS